jgi:hypothetical protein
MFVLGGSGSESDIHSMNCLKVCFFNQEEKIRLNQVVQRYSHSLQIHGIEIYLRLCID